MSSKLEHVSIRVASIDGAIDFLTTAMPDFRVRGGGEEGGQRWVHLGTDDSYVALTEDARREVRKGPGLNHVGFVVEDGDALRARMEAAGYREGFVPRVKHPYHRRQYFLDASGMEWEFVEYFSDDPSLRNDYSH